MFDHDVLSVDDAIGRASFPIRNLRNGEEQEVDVEVEEESAEKVDQMMVCLPESHGCMIYTETTKNKTCGVDPCMVAPLVAACCIMIIHSSAHVRTPAFLLSSKIHLSTIQYPFVATVS